jgi:hypothetical protein
MQPWYESHAYGQTEDLIDETQTLINQGGQVIDETSVAARQNVPLHGRPQLTMMLAAGAAGLVGGVTESPFLGLVAGLGLGWFAHRTWGPRQHDAMGRVPRRR